MCTARACLFPRPMSACRHLLSELRYHVTREVSDHVIRPCPRDRQGRRVRGKMLPPELVLQDLDHVAGYEASMPADLNDF